MLYLTPPVTWLVLKVRNLSRSEEWRNRELAPPPSGSWWRRELDIWRTLLLVDLVLLIWPVSIPLVEVAQRRERRRAQLR